MLLERYYDDALAQASYLIACEACGDAVVVDPNRDVKHYIDAAAARRLRIRFVTETHIHADFLSGSRELARAADATLLLSGHGGAGWNYRLPESDSVRLLQDGEDITMGGVRLTVMHTPGHTPEHLAFLVTDAATGAQPMGMISGDFVFVGDVGRPDLLERAAMIAGSMDGAARQLYASLRRLDTMPDYLQIWPGHGAGSACGKALGAVPQTTLGYERLYNPAMQHRTEDDFVRWVLADQPEPPPYFAMMKRLNRDGPPPQPTAMPPQADGRALAAAFERGDWVVDARGSRDFARSHIAGSINIPASKSFATYAGTVLSYDRPITLIARDAAQAGELIRQLRLIGLDQVRGWAAADVVGDHVAHGRLVEQAATTDVETLARRGTDNGVRVVDVRGTPEWKDAHLPNATHIYLGDLAQAAGGLSREDEIVCLCAGGTRSSIAASLLRARGFTNVSNLRGGIDEWVRRGLPVVRENAR